MDNKKILYISLTNLSDLTQGISKKVFWQSEAFFNSGYKIFNTSVENKKLLLLCNGKITEEIKSPIKSYTAAMLPMFWVLPNFIRKHEINILYVRYNKFISLLLFYLKIILPNIKIYLEMPTYPLLKEYTPPTKYKQTNKNIIKTMFVLFDYILGNCLINKSVCKIVTYSNHSKIMRKDTIKINNGYGDFTKIANCIARTSLINLTIVATFGYWHGVDRIIDSLSLYKKPGILLNIVGDGECLDKLKKIVANDEYLSSVVKFWGWQSGEKLLEIYKNTNIAIASLGGHRKGITTTSELKIREYLSLGLPIVYSLKDPSIPIDFPAAYKVSSSDEPFDIDRILNWYSNLTITSAQIRDFAKVNLSWNRQIQPIITDIENEN